MTESPCRHAFSYMQLVPQHTETAELAYRKPDWSDSLMRLYHQCAVIYGV